MVKKGCLQGRGEGSGRERSEDELEMSLCDVSRQWWEVLGPHAESRGAYGNLVILGVTHPLKMGILKT